jgi:hypothetical protein
MRNITYRIVSGLVLIAAIAGIIFLAYNAGMTRGEALSAQAPVVQNNNQPVPVYGVPYWHPFPFFGFGFFGVLALLFLFFLAMGAARRMLWGPRHGWHMWHHRYGAWGDKDWEKGIPSMMSEMHRRMHAAEEGRPADQSAQK